MNEWMNVGEEWTNLRRATCAAMTRCLSTTNWQLGHWHSRHRHNRLWPLRHEMTPWLRHRAHLGVRSNLRPPPRTNRSGAVGVFISWRREREAERCGSCSTVKSVHVKSSQYEQDRKCEYNLTLRRVWLTVVLWKNSITSSECVF
jgi:hypothetical protein